MRDIGCEELMKRPETNYSRKTELCIAALSKLGLWLMIHFIIESSLHYYFDS